MISNPQRAERQISSWAKFAIVLALLAWMAIVWWNFGRTVIRSYSPLPYFDYWNTVSKIDDYRNLNITVLWQQHGEHRIVFPEIIFAADYLLFRGREILPVALSVLFYFGTWLIFSVTLYRNRQLPRWIRQCGILSAGIVMGWQGAAFLMAGPFLVQWSLLLVAALLALFLLTYVPGARRAWIYLAGSIACAVVCTYTSANGLLLWPVVLLAAWSLHLKRAQQITLAISAVAAIGLYFVHYHFLPAANSGSPLAHPFYALSFVAAYLGMPFTVIGPRLGISLGIFEFAAYVVFVLTAFKHPSRNVASAVVLLGFYLFCLFTAAATAMGRMDPQDPAFTAATAHRYIIVPLAAHAALIFAAALLCGISRRHLWVSLIVIFAFCFPISGKSRRIGRWSTFAENSLSNCQLASLAFQSGVDDSGLMETVFPGAGMVRQALPILRKYRLSSFAGGETERLGQPAASVFRSIISEGRETGAVLSAYPIESGLLVLGWTDSPHRIWHPQKLVLVDEQKRIVGFGEKLPGELPAGLASPDIPSSLAWVGFVNLGFQSKSFTAYVVEGHGSGLVPIGKPTVIPPFRVLDRNQIGAALPGLQWNLQGSWIKNGSLPHQPPSLSYYSSHATAGANTGVLASAPFAKPAANCVAFASAHGASVEGLAITLIDANNRTTVAEWPMLNRYPRWSFWSIELPPNMQQLQILAQDRGRGPEQWLAISEPYSCK